MCTCILHVHVHVHLRVHVVCCMCMCMWLQPAGHMVAACHTYGCSLWRLRLQAGSLAYLSRIAEEKALGAELAAWLGEGVGAEMVSNPNP